MRLVGLSFYPILLPHSRRIFREPDMANYVSLDEAAKLLGLPANELIEMRSRGEIFGFRDGTSWKFKSDEIERVRQELSGDVLDDDAGGSSILVSERPGSSSKSGIILGGDDKKNSTSLSDLQLDDELGLGSDVALVPDPSSGSGLRLVNRNTPPASPADDDELRLEGDDEIEVDASSISLGSGSELSLAMGSDLNLADETPKHSSKNTTNSPASGNSDVISGSDPKLQSQENGGSPDLILGDSDGDLDLGDDLKLSKDDDDDLVLSSGSDLALSADSGINLMAPSDSGLSLEDDEPLNLEGAGISGLDLGSAVSLESGGSGSDVGSASGSGGFSGIDFGTAGEDFQLSPSDGLETDEDSGSQVIEIEDSTELGGGFPSDGFGNEGAGGFLDDGLGMAGAGVAGAAMGAVAYRESSEVPLATWEVLTLLTIVLVLGLSGLLVTDIVRNMWSWSETDSNVTSWFTEMIINSLGMES
jgi:Helix-turn-helix domain